jgi:hypothetical protein
MPYKTDQIPLGTNILRRTVKLLDCQKEMIVWWRKEKGYSYNHLARMFGVSKRTVQFIIDPQKKVENLKRREERGGWKQYYDKKNHAASTKEHRNYKRNILK